MFVLPLIAACTALCARRRQKAESCGFGGRVIGIRPAVGLTPATRNVGVALVIATASFPDSAAVTAVIAVVMFQTLLLALIALWMGRFSSAPQQPEGKRKQCLRRFSRRREVSDYFGREVPSPWRSSADASSLSSVSPKDRSMVDCSRCCQYLKA